MKKFILIALAAVLTLGACKKIQSYDDSKVTYYLDMELAGDQLCTLAVNTPWVDPGCKVYDKGVDVSDKLVITGSVDTAVPGYYPLMYSATNADGFASISYREVLVYDPSVTDDISGTYTTQSGTTRTYGGIESFPDISPITITNICPGMFSVSCLIGGYYSMFQGRGDYYSMTGMIQIDETDHSVKLLSSYIMAWGDGLDDITNGIYDTTTGEISYDAQYVGNMLFTIKLKKN